MKYFKVNGMFPSKKLFAKALLFGTLFFIFQLFLFMSGTGQAGWAKTFESLCIWDCSWASSVVENGYLAPNPPTPNRPETTNMNILPALPLISSFIAKLSVIPAKSAVIISSQLVTWIFWMALFVVLSKWRIPMTSILGLAFLIITQPAAFYMVVGYTEPLLMLFLLLYIHHLTPKKLTSKSSILFCALASIGMNASRIVALPLAGLRALVVLAPELRGALRGRIFLKHLTRELVIMLMSLMGFLGFLLFSHFQFGEWNYYFKFQKAGWGVEPKISYLWQITNWTHFSMSSWIPNAVNAKELSRFQMTLCLWLCAIQAFFIIRCWKDMSRYRRHVVISFLAAIPLFVLPIVTMGGREFDGLLRYTFPVYLSLCVGFVCLLEEVKRPLERGILLGLFVFLIVWSSYAFWVQLDLFQRYLHFRWVA